MVVLTGGRGRGEIHAVGIVSRKSRQDGQHRVCRPHHELSHLDREGHGAEDRVFILLGYFWLIVTL